MDAPAAPSPLPSCRAALHDGNGEEYARRARSWSRHSGKRLAVPTMENWNDVAR